MTRLLLTFAVLCTTTLFVVNARPTNAEPDEFSLERLGPDEARVDYYNSASRQSGNFPRELTVEDLTVALDLDIGQGPEILSVYPPEGWIAVPPFISVVDGDMGSIMLIRGVHLGN